MTEQPARVVPRPEIRGNGGTAPAARPKLQIRNLNFYYGGYHALKSISMDIPERMVTAFIGPSGCGKSTLLRTLNKMYALYPEQRAEGEIMTLTHDYPDRTIDLVLWRATITGGVPHSLDGQALKWVDCQSLGNERLLPADAPFIGALQLISSRAPA